MNSKRNFFERYELLSSNNLPCIVGLGGNSQVQAAKNKENQKLVAVKKIHRKLALKESFIHSQLNHPNIVQFIESFMDSETGSSFIVLAYMPNNTLSDYINQNPSPNEQEVCKMFIGICQGLKAIHEKLIIHRDVKPSNILFDQEWNAKICDFGNAIDKQKSMEVCGTLEYMAPQILTQKQYNSKVDIWAVGVMMYQILQRKLPFYGKNTPDLLNQMTQPLQFSNINSRQFVEIIQKILNFTPNKRPQLSQVISFLEKLQKSLRDEQNDGENSQDNKKSLETHEESQNTSIDQSDEDFQEKLVINRNHQSEIKLNYHKAISLKRFRNLNQNKIMPNLIVHKPHSPCLTERISNLKALKPAQGKISIKQLLMRKKLST